VVASLSSVGTYAQPSPSLPYAIPGRRGALMSTRFDHPPDGVCHDSSAAVCVRPASPANHAPVIVGCTAKPACLGASLMRARPSAASSRRIASRSAAAVVCDAWR
jgi:hypothetical protein